MPEIVAHCKKKSWTDCGSTPGSEEQREIRPTQMEL